MKVCSQVAVAGLGLLAALGLAPAVARAADRSDEVLVGRLKTARFEIRYRPGSRAAADVERTSMAAERDLDRIAKELEVEIKGPFHLWIYDDVDELSVITGTKGNGGYSTSDGSHVPYDNDQTRIHELVHIVAATWTATGKEPRTLFHAEGLANAVLGFVHGVNVHAVAAFERKAKRLPALSEMTGAPDFYAWLGAHPGLDAYDLAASWYRHLIDQFGPFKTRKYYGGVPAKEAFGAELAALEKGWHATLDAYGLRPEVVTLLRQRRGEPAAFEPYAGGLPAGLLGKPEDWTTLSKAEMKADPAKAWTRKGDTFQVVHPESTWATCELGDDVDGDCVIHATVQMPKSCPIELRLGAANRGLLVQSMFLYKDETPLASSAGVSIYPDRKEADFYLVRRGDMIDLWIDGAKVLSAKGSAAPAKPGIGVNGGTATFEDVRIRRLR